jgi:hypothetical protein
MAVAFDLTLDFRDNKQHAETCCAWLAARASGLVIDSFHIAIHSPFVAGYPYGQPTHFQVSMIPADVGINLAIDKNRERIPLDDVQLSQLGNHLYNLLRGAPHFDLAMVGWDVDSLLDVQELNGDWAKEIRVGAMHGLVVHIALLEELPRSNFFVPFDEDHQWIPYVGSKRFGT